MPTTVTRKVPFGFECKLFLSANAGVQQGFVDSQAIGSVKDLAQTFEETMEDIGDRDSGGSDSEVPTSTKIGIEFNMNCRKDKPGYLLLRAAQIAKQPLAFACTNKENDVVLAGDAYVSNFKQDEKLKSPVDVTVNLSITTELRPVINILPTWTSGTETSGTWGTASTSGSTSGSNSTGGN